MRTSLLFPICTSWVLACSVDQSLPAGTRVSCATNADCPATLVCRAAIARCVDAGDEEEPPGAVDIQLGPPVVGHGAVVTVSFTATEPLERDPEVTLDALSPFVFTVGAVDADRYTFELEIRGNEGEGTFPVTATLVDQVGNVAENVPLGSVRVDLTAPQIVGDVITSPLWARRDAQVTFEFGVNEALGPQPEVRVMWSGGEAMAVFAGLDTGTNVYTYTHLGGSASEPEGLASLSIALLDQAGNQTVDVSADVVTLDFTAPQLQPGSVDVLLLPSSTNLLTFGEVTAVTFDTRVLVVFAVNEVLDTDPTLRAGMGQTWDFALQGAAGPVYRFDATFAGELSDGPHPVLAPATDLAGNSVDLAVGNLDIDTTAPVTPDTDREDAAGITYRRYPWGDAAAPGVPRFEVEGGFIQGVASAAPPSDHVFIFGDAGAIGILGRGLADSDGAFGPLPLQPIDKRTVWAGFVDHAGNLSTLRSVRTVEWVATIGNKTAGSTFGNPHTFTQHPMFGGSGTGPSGIEVGAGQGADGDDGLRLSTRGAGSWRRAALPASLSLTANPINAVWDDQLAAPVLYIRGDDTTWTWSGTRWEVLPILDPEGDGQPAYGVKAQMAFDPRREVTLLNFGETWELSGRSWARVPQLDLYGDGAPEPRWQAGTTYDALRGETVVYGGTAGPTCDGSGFGTFDCGGTWTWDGRDWHRRCDDIPAGDSCTGPSERRGPAMAYDAGAGEVVLFGGANGTSVGVMCTSMAGSNTGMGCYYRDTWTWDGQSWTEKTTSQSPEWRARASMVYDADRDTILLFGGVAALNPCPPAAPLAESGNCYYDDTWKWDGKDWSRVDVADPERDGQPQARADGGFVYDRRARTALLVSGETTFADSSQCRVTGGVSRLCEDTWRFDGRSWARMGPVLPAAPLARSAPAIAQRRVDNQMLLFGGTVGLSSALGDLWAWNGYTWSLEMANPGAPNPPGVPRRRFGHAMVFEEDFRETYMFGGSTIAIEDECDDPGDGWLCEGVWARTYSGGGTDNWVKYSSYLPSETNHPDRRRNLTMAYDFMRREVVLQGGSHFPVDSPVADTWEYSPRSLTWTNRCTNAPSNCSPLPPTGFGQLVFVPTRGTTAMVGQNGDLWEWDGTAWSMQSPAASPDGAPTINGPIVWDRTRDALLMYGATSGLGGTRFEPWELDLSTVAWRRLRITDLEGDTSPAFFIQPALAFDDGRAETFLFGGREAGSGGTPLDDTWIWHSGASRRPAHVFRAVLAAAGETTDRFNDIRVNFAPAGTAASPGYLADTGDAFAPRGNGYTYGWSGAGVPMNTFTPDRYGTAAQTQQGGDWIWELEVPDGAYEVHLVAGGPGVMGTTIYDFAVEGVSAIGGVTHASAFAEWHEALVEVVVSDGRLTLTNGINAVDNLLPFIEVRRKRETLREVRAEWVAAGAGRNYSSFERWRLSARTLMGAGVLNATFGSTGIAPDDTLQALDGRDPNGRWRVLIKELALTGFTVTRWCLDMSASNGGVECENANATLPGYGLFLGDIDLTGRGLPPLRDLQIQVELDHPNHANLTLELLAYPVRQAVDGVEMQMHVGEEWRSVATSSSPVGSPEAITWAETDPDTLSALRRGPNEAIEFLVRPMAPNGDDYATIETDHAQVRVRYLLR